MAQTINPNLHPIGGWKFKDSTGVTHVGHDLESLAKVIAGYRRESGLEPGDPRAEVTAAVCKRSPQICTGRKTVDVTLKALAVYVAHFISKASLVVSRNGKRPTVEEPFTAHRRLMLCKTCPHCIDWSKGCAPCQRGSETLLGNAIQPHAPVPGSEKLACEIARDSVAVSAFDLNPAPIPNAPEFCWRRGPQQ